MRRREQSHPAPETGTVFGPSSRPGLTRARLVCLAAVSSVAALVLLAGLAQPAGADASRASSINVVGSGTFRQPHVLVLAAPRSGAKRIAVMSQFRPDYRPQYVLALDVVRAKTGRPVWYRITVPGRPNGQTGWVRARQLELRPVKNRLVVFRGERRFEYWERDRLVRKGRVAVGKPGAETPTGLFFVTWKFSPKIDPSWSILGDYAFETSAYSRLTDWPGGGIVGVHGTPWPSLLGQAVSHGCIRMHNRDILFLKSRVSLGMPVKVVP